MNIEGNFPTYEKQQETLNKINELEAIIAENSGTDFSKIRMLSTYNTVTSSTGSLVLSIQGKGILHSISNTATGSHNPELKIDNYEIKAINIGASQSLTMFVGFESLLEIKASNPAVIKVVYSLK